MKNNKKLWVTGALCLLPFVGNAQQSKSLVGVQRLFEDGKELFLRHDYAAARQTLTKYIHLNSKANRDDETAYMLACTAYELGTSDNMEQLESFLFHYPESRYVNRVRSLLGSVCFFHKDYVKAISTYGQADLGYLSETERDDCTYRLALSYLETGQPAEASTWFNVLKSISSAYRNDAIYHLAYISYLDKKYDAALEGFRSVSSSPKYASLSPYYIADIYLNTQDYSQAESVASSYLRTYPAQDKSIEMTRIKGESLYGLGRYTEAISDLEKYRAETENAADRNAMYKLGMSYYNTGAYSRAATAFSETEQQQDALAQNAYFHQGLSYLQLKDRNRARMSFEQASAMTVDNSIREQALYNYALCLHETSYSPFAESVTVFERFLNEFPESVYAEKVNGYLVEVYMNSRNYETALASIAKISHPGVRILEAKQKLLFRLGTQSVAQAKFDEAINYFTQSLQVGAYDKDTQADAYYWRGESKYRKEQYEAAAADFRQYLNLASSRQSEEYGLALYNLGYTSFKRKNYENALEWFTRCAEQSAVLERSVIADTYNRMGDCNFYARRFDTARSLYAQASATDSALGDYSLFQEGFVKGLQRDYNGKIQTLNRLLTDYPSSQYIDDALYEQGRAFVQLEDNSNAIQRYSLLVQRYPESPLSRKAANEIGLLYYQDDKYTEAIAAYKKVITDYSGSEEARLAQRDLRSIYVDLNKVDEYMAFASSQSGGLQMDVTERDSLTYVAAERVYLRGNTTEAKQSFSHYLQSFPNGAFSIDAHYYLGAIAYAEKNYNDASEHLDKVIAYPANKYSSEALSLGAEIAYQKKEYAKAKTLYKQMADRSTTAEARLSALTGALRSAWMAGDEKETISEATALLAQSKLSPELTTEAYYYRAKMLLKEKQWDAAATDLRMLAKDTRNVYGAEGKYLLAQLYYDLGETAKSEKEVLDYIEVSTPHAYWLARGFILLSDVYVKLGRNLDAKQYLLSLKQNYQANDDIAGMIETRLAKLKK